MNCFRKRLENVYCFLKPVILLKNAYRLNNLKIAEMPIEFRHLNVRFFLIRMPPSSFNHGTSSSVLLLHLYTWQWICKVAERLLEGRPFPSPRSWIIKLHSVTGEWTSLTSVEKSGIMRDGSQLLVVVQGSGKMNTKSFWVISCPAVQICLLCARISSQDTYHTSTYALYRDCLGNPPVNPEEHTLRKPEAERIVCFFNSEGLYCVIEMMIMNYPKGGAATSCLNDCRLAVAMSENWFNNACKDKYFETRWHSFVFSLNELPSFVYFLLVVRRNFTNHVAVPSVGGCRK